MSLPPTQKLQTSRLPVRFLAEIVDRNEEEASLTGGLARRIVTGQRAVALIASTNSHQSVEGGSCERKCLLDCLMIVRTMRTKLPVIYSSMCLRKCFTEETEK